MSISIPEDFEITRSVKLETEKNESIYLRKAYVQVFLLHRARGNHGGHAVATKTVSEHRSHHRVTVRHMAAILLGQSHNDLEKAICLTLSLFKERGVLMVIELLVRDSGATS